MYIFGGRDLSRTYDVRQTFEYNIKTGAWSIKADMPNPRNHIAGAAVNGKVYAIGGQHGEARNAVNQRSVHRYDPSTNTWTSVASLPFAVSHNFASTFEYQGSAVRTLAERLAIADRSAGRTPRLAGGHHQRKAICGRGEHPRGAACQPVCQQFAGLGPLNRLIFERFRL